MKKAKQLDDNIYVRYYIGGHVDGIGARANYGKIIGLAKNYAWILTQNNKIHETVILDNNPEHTTYNAIQYLSKKERKLFLNGKLKDEQPL